MKINTLLIAVMFLAVTSSAFAETYTRSAGTLYRTIKGEVVSVDAAKGTFIIKDEDGGARVAISAFQSALESLTAGDLVSVTTQKSSNLASEVLNLGQAVQLAKKNCVCPHSK